MDELLTLAHGFPTRTLEPGEVLLVDRDASHDLFVLLEGALRIEKAGVPITTVTQPGACVGEMSLLLGVPTTADVVATERSVLAVVDNAPALLESNAELALVIARLLAQRLQAMTTYLVDLKLQYADHEGGLGMVDVVLGSLMQSTGPRSSLGSDRDPHPEYYDARLLERRLLRARLPNIGEREFLDAGQAGPARVLRVGVDLDVGRDRTDLPAHVEDERRSDAIDPASVVFERGLVHMATQHQVGMVLLDPPVEVGVAVVPLARPARGGVVGRCVVHPDPGSAVAHGRVLGELTINRSARHRSIPPLAHRHECVVGAEARPVDEDARGLRRVEPHRGAFTVLVVRVEIVIAGARDDGGLRREAREILEHHRDLRVGLDDRGDVEVVAGYDHELVVGRHRCDPVELLERVVQVGDQEDPHQRRTLPGALAGPGTVSRTIQTVRVVSLLPSATEIVFALGRGDDLVGVTFECDFPPEARSRRVVSTSALPEGLSPGEIDSVVSERIAAGEDLYRLDERALADLDAEVVLTQDLCAVCAVDVERVDDALEYLGCSAEVVTLDPARLDDVLESILTVGKVLDATPRADELVASLRGRLAVLDDALAGASARPVVFLEWTDPPFSAGHWLPDLVTAGGGETIAAHPGENARRLEWEAVTESGADVFVVSPCGYHLDAAADLTAEVVAAGRFPTGAEVWAVDADAYFVRPGPRVLDGAEIMAAILHPDRIGPPDATQARRIRG